MTDRTAPALPAQIQSPAPRTSTGAVARPRRSIRAKLTLAFLMIALFALASALGYAYWSFSRYADRSFKETLEGAAAGETTYLYDYRDRALHFARVIAGDPEVLRTAGAGDREGLLKALKPLLEATGLDFVTVTDGKGTVLARTNEPEKFGDAAGDRPGIRSALGGTPLGTIESGALVRLSARGGAPIRGADGQVLGVVSAGYDLTRNSDFVDTAKKVFRVDNSLCLGDERVATTLVRDGKRILGVRLAPEIAQAVLQEGKPYSAFAMTDTGRLAAAYFPLNGPDGKPMGVIAVAQPTAEVDAVKRSLLIAFALLGVLVMTASYLTARAISGRIGKPIAALVEDFRRMGEGDLTVRSGSDSDDEIGLLAAGFDSMVEELRRIVARLKSAAQELSAGAQESAASGEEVTATLGELADSSRNLAAQTHEGTRAAVEASEVLLEMSSLLQISRNLADSAVANSRTTLSAAQGGADLVGRTIERMDRIQEKTRETVERIQELGELSGRIGLISDTITALADQTNLLALNAAIEAARAGEAGRGFAVVAEEVRKLAEQSQEGAREVAELVGRINKSTQASVGAMQESRGQVEEGVRFTHESGEALAQILDAVGRTVSDIQRILATAGEEVAKSDQIVSLINRTTSSIEAVDAHVDHLADATRDTNAAMENVASTAEQISAMADELKAMSDRFTV